MRHDWKLHLVVVLSLSCYLSGCGMEPFEKPPGRNVTNSLPLAAGGDTIPVASFNIQVFGISKSKNTKVMSVLARTIRKFDVVAVQEIRSKDQTVLPQFIEQINDDGAHYRFVIGPRLG